jgi:hypothetical protein
MLIVYKFRVVICKLIWILFRIHFITLMRIRIRILGFFFDVNADPGYQNDVDPNR